MKCKEVAVKSRKAAFIYTKWGSKNNVVLLLLTCKHPAALVMLLQLTSNPVSSEVYNGQVVFTRVLPQIRDQNINNNNNSEGRCN